MRSETAKRIADALAALGLPAARVEHVSMMAGCQYTHCYPGLRYGWFTPADGGEVMLVFEQDVSNEGKRLCQSWFSLQNLGLQEGCD